MKGFVKHIESIAVKNEEFRRVLYTAKNCQLVVMALKPQVVSHSSSTRSTRRPITETALSTIPAGMRRLTTNTLTARRRNDIRE